MIKNELPQPLSSAKLLAPKFISRLRQEGYFVDDLLREIEETSAVAALGDVAVDGRIKRQTAIKVIRRTTGLDYDEIKAGLFNPERDEQLPLIQQTVALLSLAWLENDLVPPDVRVKQVARRTGLAPERIIKLVDMFQPEIKNGSGNYVLDIIRSLGLSPKRILKSARYQSRPPGGGPVQRARLQDKNIPGVIRQMAVENTKISFVPIDSQFDSQPEFSKNGNRSVTNLAKSEKIVSPDVAEVTQYFRQRASKGWLRGTDEKGLTDVLSRLSTGQQTDLPLWNCFEFNWKQKRPNEYPSCIIEDDIDASIVVFNLDKVRSAIEWLALLGPVSPVVLVPTNETNAPVWRYVQTPAERENMVNSVVSKLHQKINNESSFPIEVLRWDDYLVSRGVKTSPVEYSKAGTALIDRTVAPKRKERMIQDDQEYFQQFEIKVSRRESQKRILYYYGVYAGEGLAFGEIVRSGRNVILLDLEEFRVGEMTALGAEGIVPIVSPLSTKEKLDYYRWKKNMISRKRKNLT